MQIKAFSYQQRLGKYNENLYNTSNFGPVFFFYDNLIIESYLFYLPQELISTLIIFYLNENGTGLPNDTLWLQQDGASPHYARSVRIYL